MIGEQKFERALARLVHLRRIGVDHHAFGHRQRAAHLQLGRFFDFHQAHAAGGLQRQAVVIAERRNLDAHLFGRIDDQRAGRGASTALPSIVRLIGSAIVILFSGHEHHASANSAACS